MADYFPGAEIIGTDLSPTQTTTAPPNIRFEVDDACSEWTYPASYFDFVHVRGLTGCIRDWPYLYSQCYKHLKPGGWFEHLEFSVQTNANPASDVYADKMYTAFSSSILNVGEAHTGMTFRTVEYMKGFMVGAGFVDVEERKFVWPIGPWPKDAKLKDLGRWGERNWAEGVEGWVMALYTRVLGVSRSFPSCVHSNPRRAGYGVDFLDCLLTSTQWTYQQVQQFVADFRSVIKDRKNHYWHEVRCVYGRKPFPHEIPATSSAEQPSAAEPMQTQ